MSLVFTLVYIRLDKFLTTAILALIIELIYLLLIQTMDRKWLLYFVYELCFLTMIAILREGGGINDVLPLIDLNN